MNNLFPKRVHKLDSLLVNYSLVREWYRTMMSTPDTLKYILDEDYTRQIFYSLIDEASITLYNVILHR